MPEPCCDVRDSPGTKAWCSVTDSHPARNHAALFIYTSRQHELKLVHNWTKLVLGSLGAMWTMLVLARMPGDLAGYRFTWSKSLGQCEFTLVIVRPASTNARWRYLSIPLTSQDFTQGHFYRKDLEKADVGHKSKLLRYRTMLVIGLLRTMWTILASEKSPGTNARWLC